MVKSKKIHVMGIGAACIQECNQCYYKNIGLTGKGTIADMNLLRLIQAENPSSLVFPYPMDIGTSLGLLPVMKDLNVTWGMTNGRTLSDSVITKFLDAGVTNLKVTLFATSEEQQAYNENTFEQYQQIKDSITMAVKRGMSIDIFNVLGKATAPSLEKLVDLADNLGATRVKFFRLLPSGNALETMDNNAYLFDQDMDEVVLSFERAKIAHPNVYLSFGTTFGINFYEKSLEEAKSKMQKSGRYSQTTAYACPAINDTNAVILASSGQVYWCIFLITQTDLGHYGTFDSRTGHITLDKERLDMSPESLRKNLKGKCAENVCYYQPVCMGGCRSTAALFSKFAGEPDPMYAGMDICLTEVYQRVFGKK